MAALAFPGGGSSAPRFSDRRLASRFPLQQELRYHLIHSRRSCAGTGETLDISSKGLLFTTSERLPTGVMVEIAMHWPARLNGNCLLQFVATGRIVRSNGSTAALRIQRYEFRTRAATHSGLS